MTFPYESLPRCLSSIDRSIIPLGSLLVSDFCQYHRHHNALLLVHRLGSHRFNNFTLSAIPTENVEDSSEESQARTKSIGRPRKQRPGDQAATLKPKKPGKSTIAKKQPKRI